MEAGAEGLAEVAGAVMGGTSFFHSESPLIRLPVAGSGTAVNQAL